MNKFRTRFKMTLTTSNAWIHFHQQGAPSVQRGSSIFCWQHNHSQHVLFPSRPFFFCFVLSCFGNTCPLVAVHRKCIAAAVAIAADSRAETVWGRGGKKNGFPWEFLFCLFVCLASFFSFVLSRIHHSVPPPVKLSIHPSISPFTPPLLLPGVGGCVPVVQSGGISGSGGIEAERQNGN